MVDTSWKYSKINRMHVELSTYCNAACPSCPRTLELIDGSKMPQVRPNLVLESISVENFKKWFPDDFLQQIDFWVFCGTHGDPMMNKDVLPIMEYVCQYPNYVVVNTNGGMRETNFWRELGRIFQKNTLPGKERRVVFSLDGLEDTNHLYRRNVNFKKVIENAKAFIDAGGNATWEYLIFKHNEHQIEEAKQLAVELGFKYFVPKKALGFQNFDNIQLEKRQQIYGKICRDSKGAVEYIIEPPSMEHINFTGNNLSIHLHENSHLKTILDENSAKDHHKENITKDLVEKKYLQILDSYVTNEGENCINVKCKSKSFTNGRNVQELYVDAYGNVFPCCYVGVAYNGNYLTMSGMQLRIKTDNHGIGNISLKNNSLQKIVGNGYLQMFEDSWGKPFEEGGILYCNMTCGEKSPIDKIYTVSNYTKLT